MVIYGNTLFQAATASHKRMKLLILDPLQNSDDEIGMKMR